MPVAPFSTRWRVLAALLLALLWTGAAVAFGRFASFRHLPDPQLVRPEFAAAAGVNLERAELEPARLAVALTNLDRAGVRWARFSLPWAEIEPAWGEFDWSRWDAVFAALAAYPDLQPVVVLDGSPAWARAGADRANPLAPPHERRHFGAFAAAVAERYGGQVRYYQIWHEPNIAPHWGSRPADPADYGGLLREAAVQIRAADADAQIVLAALAPTAEAGGANLSDITYLGALYALGGRAWFDIVAAQPYGFSAAPDAPADLAALNFGRAGLLRGVMLRHGDGATPLWATAFGWNAPRDGQAAATTPWGQVSAAQQAEYARQAYRMAARQQPWLGPLFWAAYCPPRPADDPWLGFALCTTAGDWRPAWDAVADAGRPEPILAIGLHRPDHSALRYSPGWRVTAAAADPSADGDLLDFSFYGTGVDLQVQGGPYWAYYRVTVDGEPANALPRDEAGAAYLVLHDPLAAARTVPLARDLPLAEHAVRVVATGGWGQWALRGIAVTDATPPPAWPAWLLVALAALGTVGWLAWGWRGRGRARTGADGAAAGMEALAGFSRHEPDRLKPRPQRDGLVPATQHPLAQGEPGRGQAQTGADDWSDADAVRVVALSGVNVAEHPERRAAARSRRARSGRRTSPHPSTGRYSLSILTCTPAQDAGVFSMQRLFARAAAWPDVAWWAAAIALALLLLLSRWTPLDLAALAGLGLVFLIRPDLSLPFIAAALPFWQRPKPILGWEFGHFELFLWVAVAALVVRWAVQASGVRGQGSGVRRQDAPSLQHRTSNIEHRTFPIPHFTFHILDYPILALLLTGLASTLIAAEQGVAWREFRIVFLFGAVFYWLITRTPWPEGRAFSWRPLVAGLLAGMAAASLIGLGQLVTGQGRIDVEGVWRVRALYGSPNNLALVLDRGVPLALALAAFGTIVQGASAWRLKSRPPLRSLPAEAEAQSAQADFAQVAAVSTAGSVALLLSLACVATFSKGALLLGLPAGIAVVLIGGAWRSGRRWPLWALAGLIVLGAAGLALLFRTPRFADLFNFESGTSFVRLKLWQGAWQMALDHPLLGVGPDNFLYAYRTRYVLPSAWEELNLSHPHNILLDLWTRLGLIGAAVGGWALIAALRAAWRQFRTGAADRWPLALGLLAGLVATVTHGLIDNSLFLPDLMGLFVVAVGLLRRMGR